jgi:putative ABC transport system permease protein
MLVRPTMEILRNIARHKVRSTLTILGIVIGVLALTTFGAFAENFNALVDGGVTYFGSSIQVAPPDGQSAALLPMSKVDDIKQVQGVAAAFPGYQFIAKPGGTGFNFGVPDTITSGDPNENSWGNFKLTYAEGHAVDARTQGEVVLGSALAIEFKKKVGDTIDLPVKPVDAKPDFVSHPFKVVGVLNKTRTAPDNFAYINIPDGQMLFKDSLPSSLQSVIDVTKVTQTITAYGPPGTSTAELDKVAVRINEQVSGVKATKPSEIVNAFKASVVFTAIVTAAALLALVIGGLSVVNTMFMAVAERVREIGLKKAVGATTTNVMGEFLIEATFVGLLGGLIGFGLGALIVFVKNQYFTPLDQTAIFLITPRLTIFAIAFATILGALAGVLPAWRAARLDPVIALRNE